jgi:hypothetical protein
MSYTTENRGEYPFVDQQEVTIVHSEGLEGLAVHVIEDGQNIDHLIAAVEPHPSDPRNALTVSFIDGPHTGIILLISQHGRPVALSQDQTARLLTGLSVFSELNTPQILTVVPSSVPASSTQDIVLTGQYLISSTVVTSGSADVTINSTTYDPASGALTVSVTTSANTGAVTLTVDNGAGETTFDVNVIELVPWTILAGSGGGDQLTYGTQAGDFIRYRSGMSRVVLDGYMYFTGRGPWSAWVRIEGLEWDSTQETKIVEWVFSTDQQMMVGIIGDSQNTGSYSQYQEGEVFDYVTSGYAYANYGQDVDYADHTDIPLQFGSGSWLKVKFTGNGAAGTTVSWYELASLDDLDDESNLKGSYVIGSGLAYPSTMLYPGLIPQDGSSTRFYAVRVRDDV